MLLLKEKNSNFLFSAMAMEDKLQGETTQPYEFLNPFTGVPNYVTDLEQKDYLTQHDKLKKHQCLECGKYFPNASKLQRHSTLHTGIKSFFCDKCKKWFTRKDNLMLHLKTAQHIKKAFS